MRIIGGSLLYRNPQRDSKVESNTEIVINGTCLLSFFYGVAITIYVMAICGMQLYYICNCLWPKVGGTIWDVTINQTIFGRFVVPNPPFPDTPI
jgi:hypothetical protein